MNTISQILESQMKNIPVQTSKDQGLRFDVFKGSKDHLGTITKVRTLGYSHNFADSNAYQLYLRMFLNEQFFLLPDKRSGAGIQFQILTRQRNNKPYGPKHHWFVIGQARVLNDQNHGLLQLHFDLLENENLFMNLYPFDIKRKPDKPVFDLKAS